ncbi:hypothetical protein RFI_21717, partial [Reticulomyxa filosa]
KVYNRVDAVPANDWAEVGGPEEDKENTHKIEDRPLLAVNSGKISVLEKHQVVKVSVSEPGFGESGSRQAMGKPAQSMEVVENQSKVVKKSGDNTTIENAKVEVESQIKVAEKNGDDLSMENAKLVLTIEKLSHTLERRKRIVEQARCEKPDQKGEQWVSRRVSGGRQKVGTAPEVLPENNHARVDRVEMEQGNAKKDKGEKDASVEEVGKKNKFLDTHGLLEVRKPMEKDISESSDRTPEIKFQLSDNHQCNDITNMGTGHRNKASGNPQELKEIPKCSDNTSKRKIVGKPETINNDPAWFFQREKANNQQLPHTSERKGHFTRKARKDTSNRNLIVPLTLGRLKHHSQVQQVNGAPHLSPTTGEFNITWPKGRFDSLSNTIGDQTNCNSNRGPPRRNGRKNCASKRWGEVTIVQKQRIQNTAVSYPVKGNHNVLGDKAQLEKTKLSVKEPCCLPEVLVQSILSSAIQTATKQLHLTSKQMECETYQKGDQIVKRPENLVLDRNSIRDEACILLKGLNAPPEQVKWNFQVLEQTKCMESPKVAEAHERSSSQMVVISNGTKTKANKNGLPLVETNTYELRHQDVHTQKKMQGAVDISGLPVTRSSEWKCEQKFFVQSTSKGPSERNVNQMAEYMEHSGRLTQATHGDIFLENLNESHTIDQFRALTDHQKKDQDEINNSVIKAANDTILLPSVIVELQDPKTIKSHPLYAPIAFPTPIQWNFQVLGEEIDKRTPTVNQPIDTLSCGSPQQQQQHQFEKSKVEEANSNRSDTKANHSIQLAVPVENRSNVTDGLIVTSCANVVEQSHSGAAKKNPQSTSESNDPQPVQPFTRNQQPCYSSQSNQQVVLPSPERPRDKGNECLE